MRSSFAACWEKVARSRDIETARLRTGEAAALAATTAVATTKNSRSTQKQQPRAATRRDYGETTGSTGKQQQPLRAATPPASPT